MKRRLFLLSGTASAALALAACGGGGGDVDDDALLEQGRKKPKPPKGGSTTTTAAVAYPFGARLRRYAAGVQPSVATGEMDAWLTRGYDAWKAARLTPADSIVSGGYAVQMSTAGFLAVSEGMGYGMLLAVLFAGHDPEARAIFDGLFAVVRARPAYAIVPHDPNGKYLMDWRLYSDGSSAGEGWNAMDGDLDIAMALLMAHEQWGSTSGSWNYLQEAKDTIGALKSWCMAADGTTKGQRLPDCSRTSDWMIGHFRAFQAATGDAFWTKAVDRAYYLSDRIQTIYAPNTGLMPEFIIKTDTAEPQPSPGHYVEYGDYEGWYYWNACRNPWRFATDYLVSGDPRWKTVTSRLVDFFHTKFQQSGDITQAVECGYKLDGTGLAGGDSPAFIAPVMLGGCVDARYQQLVDAAWKWNVANPTSGYYDGEIQLLSSVVASGNWWTPGA